ncbi:hypothetical protein [Streptomyces sp. NRRL F-5755]|uniref:hypothetical protein n=1 Tax=Streptomyces sp. NRRL F-5755 TaxID=1519475 RepID=UPI0006AFA984|nr:hypothetical protein [Streptomyces sp. NRRL F-5755]
MRDSLMAVIGTLAGVALASTTQFLSDRRQRIAQQRARVAETPLQLLDIIFRYREDFWMLVAEALLATVVECRGARLRARLSLALADETVR